MNKVSLRRGFGPFFLVVFSLALFSCSNASSGYDPSSLRNSYPVVRFVANMQSDLATAPQEISGLVSASAGTESFCDDGISRSAMPEIAIGAEATTGVKYYVEAVTGTVGTDSYIRHFVSGTSSTLELGLESGKTWSVTCGIGDVQVASSPNGGEYIGVVTVYMSDSDPSVTISPDNPVYTKTFGLKPFVTEGGKGNLKLYVSVPSGYVIRTDSDTLVFFKNGEFTPSSSPAPIEGTNLKSGSHEVIFKVYDTNEVLVYCATQIINIFDNMTTNQWRDDGSGAFENKIVVGKNILVFSVTDELIKQFVDNTIYVGATGFGLDPNDNNVGTAFSPLKKLNTAFTRIKNTGNGKDYRIYICGTLDEPNMDVPVGIDSTKAASITIEGYNGLDSSGNPKDKVLGQPIGSPYSNKAFLKILSSVPITTKNIWLAKNEGESGKSRGLYLQSGANVTLGPGTVISGFDAGRDYDGDFGGGVYVESGAALTVKGAVIKDNCAYEGGGIYIEGDGSVTMSIDGSQITGNHALYGGGISVKGAKVKITKTSISGNKADLDEHHDLGGGLALWEGSDVTLGSGAVVKENTARIGGGVTMTGAALTLDGGQIIQNHAIVEGINLGSGCGGGIDFSGLACSVNVYRGSISGNTAENLGGGIFFNGDQFVEEDVHHLLHVTGGTIENNKAENGGGAIYIYPPNADESVDNTLTFNLGGSAYIPYGVNGAEGAGKNDIYFAGHNNETYAKITLQSALSKHGKTNPVAIRIADAGAKRGVVAVQSSFSLESLKDSFKLYSDDWNLKLSSDKKTLTLDSPIWVAGSGAKQCTGTPTVAGPGTKSAPYYSIYRACDAMTDLNVDYTIYVDGKLSGAHGTAEGAQAASITIQGANGDNSVDVLDGQGSTASHMLSLLAAVDVTIKDLKITGAKITATMDDEDRGGGVYSATANTVTLSSGTLITDNKAANGGAGVCKINGKLVIEDGAEISQNEATGKDKPGGGIFLKGADFEMTGGLIKANKSNNENTNGGGIYFTTNSKNVSAKISGGTITKNQANKGAGVFMNSGDLYMSGGVIGGTEADTENGNYASESGGGLYIFSNAKAYLWSKTLVGRSDVSAAPTDDLSDKRGNTAVKGAGIYVYGAGQLWLGYMAEGQPAAFEEVAQGVMGGVIGNYATSQGGGIWNEGKLHVASGQIAFNGANISSAYGGGIYASATGEHDISGGSVVNNRANKGGAIYNSPAKKFAIGGDAYIPCGTNEKNEIYLASYTADRVMNLLSPLTKHKASGAEPIVLRLNTSSFSQGYNVVQSNTESPFVLSDADKKCFRLAKEHVDDDLALRFSADSKALSLDKPLFVRKGGTADPDTADGTRAKPFASIADACAAMTDATKDYTILVLGTLEGAQTIPQTISSEDVKANSITIMGANGLYPADHATNPGEPIDALDGKGCNDPVLTAMCACPVVLGNIKITGANHGANGGGIHRKNGDLYIQEGTLITRNTAWRAAGVFVSDCNLYMSGGQITSNEQTQSGTYSGGICSIRDNSHNYGVFIYGTAVIGGVNKNNPACPTNRDETLANGGNYTPSAQGGGVNCRQTNLYLGYKSANDEGTPIEAAEWKGGIYGNYAGLAGGGVFVTQGKMYMNSGQIAYNYTKSNGGGIGLEASDSPHSYGTLSGGKIHHNFSANDDGGGGGVYVSKNTGDTFEMIDGEIYANEASSRGGGVFVNGPSNLNSNRGTFIMSGGSIYGNKAKTGGGIYNVGKTFIYGAALIGGKEGDAPVTSEDSQSVSNRGGGIYNAFGYLYLGYKSAAGDGGVPLDADKEEWTGGIYCNLAKGGAGINGGGSTSLFYMNSGTIKGNYASEGDGGGIKYSGDIHMTGGLITQNHCVSTKNGSGVYMEESSAKFYMSGPACILPEEDGTNDVCFGNTANTITIAGALNPTVTGKAGGAAAPYAAQIKLLDADYVANHVVLTKGDGVVDATFQAGCGKFKTDSDDWLITNEGKLASATFSLSVTSGVPGLTVTGDGSSDSPYQLQYNGVNKLNLTMTGGSGSFTFTPLHGGTNKFEIDNSTPTAPVIRYKTDMTKDDIATTGYTYDIKVKDTVSNREQTIYVQLPYPTTYGYKTSSADFAAGDIVFNDGSAVSYYDDILLTNGQKENAIAVIFYKGTECNDSTDSGSANIGIALENAYDSWKNWCISGASGITVTTDLSYETQKNGANNKIYVENIGDYSDANYPAFSAVASYTKNGIGNWYIPTYQELNCFLNGENRSLIENAIVKAGGAAMDGDYWTSSKFAKGSGTNPQKVYYYSISSDNFFTADILTKSSRVRPVRRF